MVIQMKASGVMKAVKHWFKRYEISRRISLQRHDFIKEEHPLHERYLQEEAKILAGRPLLASSIERAAATTKKKNPLVEM